MPDFPSATSASGIWTLKKHKRARQGNNWPGQGLAPGSSTYGMVSSYYGPTLYTINSGTSWASLYGASNSYSYGGISSGDSFIATGDTLRVYDSTFTSYQENATFPSTARGYKNPETGTIIVQSYSGLYRSINNGASYSLVYTRNASSFSSGLHYGNGVWFHSWVNTDVTPRTQHHVVSTNDGATWTTSGISGLPSTSFHYFDGFSGYMNSQHHAWLPSPNGFSIELYTSTNGFSWSFANNLGSPRIGNGYGQGRPVFFRDSYYYAVTADSVARISRSTNGWNFVNWGNVANANYTGYSSVAYINGFWIIVGGTGDPNYQMLIYQSPDPVNGVWTLRYTGQINSYGALSVMGINQNNPN